MTYLKEAEDRKAGEKVKQMDIVKAPKPLFQCS